MNYSKTKKTYMEINWGEIKSSILVAERNPLIFSNDSNRNCMIGIRFYDVREVEFYDKHNNVVDKIIGKEENYSPMYYFGKRFTIEQFKNRYNMFIGKLKELEEKGITSVIVCDCGYIISNPEEESMTIDEYEQSVKEVEIPLKKLHL